MAGLAVLQQEIHSCRACPRLVAWREQVAREKVARFRQCTYWGRPVSGFGDPGAQIVIVGLAPGAHGANRTGRMFTGDRSGDFLYAGMHRAGLASQPTSTAAEDGLTLVNAYIVAAARCAPPENLPRPDELARCAPFLDAEIALLPAARVLLALGAIAWRACLDHLARREIRHGGPKLPAFAHGAVLAAPPWVVLGSFHVSQQNTQTGRLTPPMFDEILASAKRYAATASELARKP